MKTTPTTDIPAVRRMQPWSVQSAVLVFCALFSVTISANATAQGLNGFYGEADTNLANKATWDTLPGVDASKALDARQLDDVRGRFVPSRELELDESLGVILWDEGRGARSGGGSTGSQQQKGKNNHQRQSMSTTTIR